MQLKSGSHAHQIIQLDERIKKLTEHLKIYKKDYATKVSLFKLVSRKKRFMKYLKNNNEEQYLSLSKKKKS